MYFCPIIALLQMLFFAEVTSVDYTANSHAVSQATQHMSFFPKAWFWASTADG